jgi:hypothetical protein
MCLKRKGLFVQRLLLRASFLAIVAVAIGSFSGASMAEDTSPKTPAASETSLADSPSWQEYKKLLENYYFLDKQKADHISCSVSVPALQGLIDTGRLKFGNQLTIDENLHDFSVTYDRTKGVSTNSPHIKISYPPDFKFANEEGFKNWRKEIEKATTDWVSEAKYHIAGILLEMSMISHSTEKQKNLSLTKNGDATIVSFDEAGNEHASDIYSGSTQKRTESSPTANLTATSDYQPLNGKLALAHIVEKMTEGSKKINMTHSISYQDLGSAFFPAKILLDIAASDNTQQVKPLHLEIDFKDCKTSDLSP